MKIKLKDACIVFLYVLVFFSAFTYLRYTFTQVYGWRVLYLTSMLLAGVICILYVIAVKASIELDSFVISMFFMVLYELITSLFNSLFIVPMILVDVIIWPLLLVIFYDYSKRKALPDYFKQITIIGCTIICIFSIPNVLMTTTANRGSAVFAAYYSFAFLPMIYLLDEKKVSVIFSVLVALLMLLSTKRSAFLIVVIGIIIYYFLKNYIKGLSINQLKRYVWLLLVFLCMGVIGKVIIDRLDIDIIDRLMNIANDGGSGRERIWKQILESYNNSTLLEKIFGHGFHAVFYEVKPLGIARYAHNSLIETLYDYGIVGLYFILLFMCNIIRYTVVMIKKKLYFAPIMGFTIIAMLVMSMVSYFFEQSLIITPFTIIWGVCIGRCRNELRKK